MKKMHCSKKLYSWGIGKVNRMARKQHSQSKSLSNNGRETLRLVDRLKA